MCAILRTMTRDDRALGARVAESLESRREILEAYLFGSHARGSARAQSDLDVAVYLDDPRPAASPFGYAADLTAALMSSLGTQRVEVVVLNEASPLLYYRVLRDGIRVSRVTSGPRRRARGVPSRGTATTRRSSPRSRPRTGPVWTPRGSVDESRAGRYRSCPAPSVGPRRGRSAAAPPHRPSALGSRRRPGHAVGRVRRHFNYRAAGLRYLSRLREVSGETRVFTSAARKTNAVSLIPK